MGRRPKAAYQASTDTGRSFGVTVTSRDQERLRMLARWYALSAGHIARAELPITDWHPDYITTGEADGTDAYRRHAYAVKRRLAKLARIEENGTISGPLASSVIIPGHETVWYPTLYGATAADAPWRIRSGISPNLVSHAWMAADIGLQIENLGYTVYSEREHASKTDQHGALIHTPIDSPITTRTGQKITKKPDVAVVGTSGQNFIAVEAERYQSRALSVYMEKLSAYQLNPSVHAVWYVCGSTAIAERVGEAADRVFGSQPFPLRIRIAQTWGDWTGIANLPHDTKLTDDLRNLA